MIKFSALLLPLLFAATSVFAQDIIKVVFEKDKLPVFSCLENGQGAQPSASLLNKATKLIVENKLDAALTVTITSGASTIEKGPIAKDEKKEYSLAAGKIEGSEMTLQAGFTVADKAKPENKVEFKVTSTGSTTRNNGGGSAPATPSFFTPSQQIQDAWRGSHSEGFPCLNRHTRYMLEYDYDRADITEVWKRSIRRYDQATFDVKRVQCDRTKIKTVKTITTNYTDCHPVQKMKMFPTVDRNVLVYVHGYHAYRDSFALDMTYEDRFLENAETFTDVISGLMAGGTQAESEAAGTEAAENVPMGTGDENESVLFVRFKLLSEELKAYYSAQKNKSGLSSREAALSVGYIKARIAEAFPGFTDFSEAGFAKYAQDHADELTKVEKENKLKEFFGYVTEAAYYFSKLASYTYFEPHSVLIKNRDALEINLQHFREGKLQTGEVEKNRMYHIRGGCKLDFSVGLFGNRLIDKEYTTMSVSAPDTTWLKNDNGTQFLPDSITAIDASAKKDSIIRDPKGSFNIGPAVFAHLYWRTGTRLNGSLSFGFALNQAARPYFLTGGSLLIGMGDGNKSRVAITTGCAFGTVKRLDSGYYVGEKITLSNLPNSKIPTKDVWKANWFVAVSFNIGGVKIGNTGNAKSKAKKS